MSADIKIGTKTNLSPNKQLLVLTREMLAAAEASEWEELAALEKSRLPIFHLVFAQGIGGNVELAREILAIDEQTKSLAEAGMPALQQEILKIKYTNEAKKAYQTIQDSITGRD